MSGKGELAETEDNVYSKLFDEKNKEIEKLNEELRKRTYDLQAVVNKELWQKNREIEKLQIKYTQMLDCKEKEMSEIKESFIALSSNLQELKLENEEKHTENSNLKIDISDLKLQLQLLRDKIGEIGLIPDDNLEVDVLISSLDDFKNIQKQLEDVKLEKDMLIEKINDLESSVKSAEDLKIVEEQTDVVMLKSQLEVSEALRHQTSEVCHILRTQLEELAIFLDSLMKQKSVLGFLGSTENRKLKEAIEHSLDLSKSLNVTLNMNPEQSLLQLSNITCLLNGLDATNATNDDSNRYSFTLVPEQAKLTYQNKLFRVGDNEVEENRPSVVNPLKDQIEMLQRELNIKNIELNRYKRESKSGKESRQSHSKLKLSPSKLKNALTFRNDKHDSESETWSEPDVNVSKARIGLFKNDVLTGVEEFQSSDSTDDSLTNLNNKRSDILNECQVTITKLNKQVQDLQVRIKENENCNIELQEANRCNNSLQEDNDKMKNKLLKFEFDLSEAKIKLDAVQNEKVTIEKEVEMLKININQMEKSKLELMNSYESKDKDTRDKLNQMKFEREQLVIMVKEYADMTEHSRHEIVVLEKKIAQLSIEKETLEKKLKIEYEKEIIEKLQGLEKEYTTKIVALESKASKETDNLNEVISKMTKNYSENYVNKSELVMKNKEIDKLKSDMTNMEEALSNLKKLTEMNGNDEKKMKEEINVLKAKLNETTLRCSEIESERLKLEQNLIETKESKVELETQLTDVHQQLNILKEQHQKEINTLQSNKMKLELKISELEYTNADLHNRLARIQTNANDHIYSTSLPIGSAQFIDINGRPVPTYHRQISNNSQSYISEDETRHRGIFSVVVPQKSLDSDRIEASSSPDLGIESDQGRFSSLEVQAQVPRPLLQTLEITKSMSNLLDGDNNLIQGTFCGNKSCYKQSLELIEENNVLKKKLAKTKKALEDTVTQLTSANRKKKEVEKNICRQIHKTSQVLREAKANLDSGSETDFRKK